MIKTRNFIYHVDVWLVVMPPEPGFAFFGDVEISETHPEIVVESGVQLITFRLHTAKFDSHVDLATVCEKELEDHQVEPEDQAGFTTNPIQWVDHQDLPRDTPVEIQVLRLDGLNFQVVNNNGAQTEENTSYPLRLLVMHKGNIFWSPDPHIINHPPDPPGEGV